MKAKALPLFVLVLVIGNVLAMQLYAAPSGNGMFVSPISPVKRPDPTPSNPDMPPIANPNLPPMDIPHVDVPRLPDSGHWMWPTDALATARLYERFLAGSITSRRLDVRNKDDRRSPSARVSEVCLTAEVILAAVAGGADPALWVNKARQSPLDYLAAQVRAGRVADAERLSCVIMAAVASGQNPRAFAGRNLVTALEARQNRQSGQFGAALDVHAYAMLALHSAAEPIPTSAVELLAAKKNGNDAWARDGSLASGGADVYTTALVVQALAAAGEIDSARAALPYLRRAQNKYGGFPDQETRTIVTTGSPTARALQALYALRETLSDWTPGLVDTPGALMMLWDRRTGGYYFSSADKTFDPLTTAHIIQAMEGMNLVELQVSPARQR